MSEIHRRTLIKQLAAGSLVVGSLPAMAATCSSSSSASKNRKLLNNINHSVCRWTYSFLSLDELCKTVKDIGFSAIDLVGPKDWPTLKTHGVFSSMCNGAEIGINEGWNDKQYHARLIKSYTEHIDLVAKAGYKNLICFSGARKGMDDETGLKNCTEGLKQIMAAAEKAGVIVQMELLNSKINHKDYMCDRSSWGV